MLTINVLDRHFHPEMLGILPHFLDPNSSRPAKEQFDEQYCGGWNPFKGFTFDPVTHSLSYPGDPAYQPLAETTLPLTGETIIFYPHAWTLILQKEGSWEVARMD